MTRPQAGSHALARAALESVAGVGIPDDELRALRSALAAALRASPDAGRAATAFGRWFRALSAPRTYLGLLRDNPAALQIFCTVTGSSDLFADLLVRNPEYFEYLAHPHVRGRRRTAAGLQREALQLLGACNRPELKRDVLRRWKAREMLAIGVRDLLGAATLQQTVREYSYLADACVRCALGMAVEELTGSTASPCPIAVIAMGKLGGAELNYSSDIDLVFLHADRLPRVVDTPAGRALTGQQYVTRIAELVVQILSERRQDGEVFRVDLRLRPEGRFGPITRSLSAWRAYLDAWAEPWERQALIKARVVAGSPAVGREFRATARAFVYRRLVDVGLLEALRDNKRLMESRTSAEGESETNIKNGTGGIRDIEFLLQALQIEYGGVYADLQTAATIRGLEAAANRGLIGRKVAAELVDDYTFLRTLEHRLQLLHGRQTHHLPSAATERAALARRMGFSSRRAFEADLARRRARVRRTFMRAFVRGRTLRSTAADHHGLDVEAILGAVESRRTATAAESRLAHAGFRDPRRVMEILRTSMYGNEFGGMPPDTPIRFRRIAGRLLRWSADAPDPDYALEGIEALATAVPNRAELYASFEEAPQVMDRLVRLAGAAPTQMRTLCRHQEWLDGLLAPDATPAAGRWETLFGRAAACPDAASAGREVARVLQRETLRIAAGDVWGACREAGVERRLTRLADAALGALAALASRDIGAAEAPVAIVGLGRLGGSELGYASDLDIVIVASDRSGPPGWGIARVTQAGFAERFLALVAEVRSAGVPLDVDLRLRPWGRKGMLILDTEGLRRYHAQGAEVWERQAMLKARHCAGSSAIGAPAVRLLRARSVGAGLSATDAAAVRAMKRRVEGERGDTRAGAIDLKLGAGGLSDVEWLVQLLQMRFGPGDRSLRLAGTIPAIAALSRAGRIEAADARLFTEHFRFLGRLRNRLWLAGGPDADWSGEDDRTAGAAARSIGYTGTVDQAAGRLRTDVRRRMAAVRGRFETLFFDEEPAPAP